MKYIFNLLLFSIVFYSCGSNDPVSPGIGTVSSNYNKILTFESGSLKIEMYSASGISLYAGYNDIGFRVFVSGLEQKSGFVKFYPSMYHDFGGPMHSSPVSSTFTFDNNKNLFTGYACFIMISDSTSNWFGNYNYNNSMSVDSVLFYVNTLPGNQMRVWDGIGGGYTYVLTLINPMNAILGLNNFTCLFHRTQDDRQYTEVNSAEMFIKPWMDSHGHGSSNNVDPVSIGGGLYEGKANFTMHGKWDVYDSIKVNGTFITPRPLPKFSFEP